MEGILIFIIPNGFSVTRCHIYYSVLLFQMADFLDYNGSITTEASEYFTTAAPFSHASYIAVVSVGSVFGVILVITLVVLFFVHCFQRHPNTPENDQEHQFAVVYPGDSYASDTDSSNQVHGIANVHPGYDIQMPELNTISAQHELQPGYQDRTQDLVDSSKVLYKTGTDDDDPNANASKSSSSSSIVHQKHQVNCQ